MKLERFPPYVFSLAMVAILATSARAPAQSTYDGGWSVLVITQAGRCDAAYSYPVQIANGIVLNDTTQGSGSGVVQISGRVEPAGQVKVIVQLGERQVVGVGKLSHNSGVGIWAGKSSGEDCSGRWEARRN